LNNGFVPILELPTGEIISESGIIMDFCDKLTGDEPWCKDMGLKERINIRPLYSNDSRVFAKQKMIMNLVDQF
jgi:glutathione S-transferase